MALATTALPFGLRDVKVQPYDDAGVLGAKVDLPVSQTFSFSEAEDFEELRGDDGVVAIRGKGPKVEWELEAGGITIDAWKVFAGGTVTTTGVTPNIKKRLRKLGTDVKPYFKTEGQAISDSGGDVHGIVYKCRASDSLEGEFADGQWFVTSASGEAIPDAAGILYDFEHNETAVTIV